MSFHPKPVEYTLLVAEDRRSKQHAVLSGIERWAGLPENDEKLPIPQRLRAIRDATNLRITVLLEDDPFKAMETLAALSGQIHALITDNQMLDAPFAKQILAAATQAQVPHRLVYTSRAIPDLTDTPQHITDSKEVDVNFIQAWLQKSLGAASWEQAA